jgi:hypothetical protein
MVTVSAASGSSDQGIAGKSPRTYFVKRLEISSGDTGNCHNFSPASGGVLSVNPYVSFCPNATISIAKTLGDLVIAHLPTVRSGIHPNSLCDPIHPVPRTLPEQIVETVYSADSVFAAAEEVPISRVRHHPKSFDSAYRPHRQTSLRNPETWSQVSMSILTHQPLPSDACRSLASTIPEGKSSPFVPAQKQRSARD